MRAMTEEYKEMRSELDEMLTKACRCFAEKMNRKGNLAELQDDAKALATLIKARACIAEAEY
ncbi:MAG: hypothetical protein HFE75_15010 [Firmicutes bacterium]|jgi:hypothetical protein|nr:hypothetical protein [Bacillota bacterium]